MKRICIYVTLGLLGAVSAHAQEINIGQAVARKISDDKVEVSFNMDCSILRLPSRRQMIITPLIISRSESDTLALPSVCIAGRNRYRMNKRKESLYGKEPAAGEGQEMIRFNRKRDMLLEYNETVPAQEWMSGARVEIFRELQGCAGCGEALGNAPVAELPLFKEVVERPNLEIMVAQAEEKRRSFTRSAYLNFKVNQSALLADYKAKFDKWDLASPGKPSPDFEAVDVDGKEYSLKDFKGKYVYIDMWATWCAPCKRELPFLKKLEERFAGKDIVFLGLSIDYDKTKWEERVKSGELAGVQLHIGPQSSFKRAYNIDGIPRFILLDKEGKIINNNMSRPSSEDTEHVLDALEGI